ATRIGGDPLDQLLPGPTRARRRGAPSQRGGARGSACRRRRLEPLLRPLRPRRDRAGDGPDRHRVRLRDRGGRARGADRGGVAARGGGDRPRGGGGRTWKRGVVDARARGTASPAPATPPV